MSSLFFSFCSLDNRDALPLLMLETTWPQPRGPRQEVPRSWASQTAEAWIRTDRSLQSGSLIPSLTITHDVCLVKPLACDTIEELGFSSANCPLSTLQHYLTNSTFLHSTPVSGQLATYSTRQTNSCLSYRYKSSLMAQMWEFSKLLATLNPWAISLKPSLSIWPTGSCCPVFLSSFTSHRFSYFFISWVKSVREILTSPITLSNWNYR